MTDLIAQAEALEWVQTLHWKDYDDLAMQLMQRAQELRAQAAAQPPAAQPVGEVAYSDMAGMYVKWRHFITVEVGASLYATPDPRIAEYRELLREVLSHWDDTSGNAITLYDTIQRIAAALKDRT